MNITKKQNITFHIVAIFLIIILAFSVSPITLQNDTFYTIKIGELISQNGIDMQDHFSWHNNMPYTYPHWAYDLIIYGIYNMFGMTGIYFSTVILACILGVCIYILNNKVCKNKIISLIVTLCAIYLLKDFIAARAQLVTFILFTLAILFIEQFIETKKKRYFIYLLIIPILIANLHVAVWPFYFVIFIPYIVEFAIREIIKVQPIICLKIAYKTIKKIFVKKEKRENLENDIQELYKKLEHEMNESKDEKKIIKNTYKFQIDNNKMLKWLCLVIVIVVLTRIVYTA